MLNKDSFIKFMHMVGGQHQWERPVPYSNHSKAQLMETGRTPKLATIFRDLIYKQNTFLRHKICALPDATILLSS